MFHRVGRTESVSELAEDSDRTYFTEAALRWRDLNLSSPFKAYLQEVSLIPLVFYPSSISPSLTCAGIPIHRNIGTATLSPGHSCPDHSQAHEASGPSRNTSHIRVWFSLFPLLLFPHYIYSLLATLARDLRTQAFPNFSGI